MLAGMHEVHSKGGSFRKVQIKSEEEPVREERMSDLVNE
jgi:hypothetical protein